MRINNLVFSIWFHKTNCSLLQVRRVPVSTYSQVRWTFNSQSVYRVSRKFCNGLGLMTRVGFNDRGWDLGHPIYVTSDNGEPSPVSYSVKVCNWRDHLFVNRHPWSYYFFFPPFQMNTLYDPFIKETRSISWGCPIKTYMNFSPMKKTQLLWCTTPLDPDYLNLFKKLVLKE